MSDSAWHTIVSKTEGAHLETSGTFSVVLEVVAVDVELVEELDSDAIVSS